MSASEARWQRAALAARIGPRNGAYFGAGTRLGVSLGSLPAGTVALSRGHVDESASATPKSWKIWQKQRLAGGEGICEPVSVSHRSGIICRTRIPAADTKPFFLSSQDVGEAFPETADQGTEAADQALQGPRFGTTSANCEVKVIRAKAPSRAMETLRLPLTSLEADS
jgi:hypothetical protein